MSTHIVATQHSFDEMLKQVKRTLLQTESVEGQMDTAQTKTPLHEQLERWGLSPWPSDERMKKANLGGRRLEEGDPDILHLHAWMEHIDNWLLAHAQPVESQDELKAINDTYDHMLMTPVADVADVLKRNQVMWETYRVLAPSYGQWPGGEAWIRPRNESVLPNFVRAYHNLPLLDETSSDNTDTRVLPLRLPRPIINPAFMHDGIEGLGRVSSSQVNLAILTACVAPKSEWTHTAKGFPKYVLAVPSGEVEVVLKPEVVVSRDVTSQVKAMEQIRDELSIDDFDLIAILQEQIMTDGSVPNDQGLISATMTDEYALDYCKLERKKRGGYISNHHPKNRANLAESLNRITHLHVRTDTLQVRKITPQRGLEKYAADWNEKVLSVEGNLTQRETDTTLVFQYTFGRSFTTYLTRPNRFVGYILQGTVALNGKKQIAKALAHYFALHLKMNAFKGPELVRSIGEILDGAKVPQRDRPRRTMESFEEAMRDLVREGLIRIKWDAMVLDTASPELDKWTAIPGLGRKHDLLDQYRRQNLTILAPKVIEERYDREIRRGRGSSRALVGEGLPAR